MKINTKINQSKARVKSGLALITNLIIILFISLFFDISWFSKVIAVITIFFVLSTLIEYWNIKRLTKHKDKSSERDSKDPG